MAKRVPATAEWLTVRQAAEDYPISRGMLWRWVREGRLHAYRPFDGRQVLLRRAEINALIAATRDPDRPTPRRRRRGSSESATSQHVSTVSRRTELAR